MTGQELVARSRAEGVVCPVLVITGHGRIVQQAEGAWWMNHPHLLKPFQYDELRNIVANLLKEPTT
jgi:DNA-binding NtrC family response regulator